MPSTLEQLTAAMTARSVYERDPMYAPREDWVERQRKARGGALHQAQHTELRWYPADIESAALYADQGDVSMAARIWQASSTDGIVKGTLSTRTGGLVRLPKAFSGPDEQLQMLKTTTGSQSSARSVFDELCPPAELAALAADGIGLGVGVAELLPVVGRTHPVLCRLPPEFLRYRREENRWYYRSIAGDLPITPGDGRWVLHMPGGRVAPWHQGLWAAVGTAWIDKVHARSYKSNWESKLANPARVAQSPHAATEELRQEWFEAVASWGNNTVFSVLPGYEVKLIESNGRGYEAFKSTIEQCEREIIIAIAGQEVTTDGGAGFQNSDIHKSIRADLIKETADGLAYTVNTQVLPIWAYYQFGESAMRACAVVEWDVKPPKDANSEAQALLTQANALKLADEALAKHGLIIDIDRFQKDYGWSVKAAPHDDVPAAKLDLAPTDIAKVVRVDEVRKSQGLPAIGDERGKLTVVELEESMKARREGADGEQPDSEQASGDEGEQAEEDAA